MNSSLLSQTLPDDTECVQKQIFCDFQNLKSHNKLHVIPHTFGIQRCDWDRLAFKLSSIVEILEQVAGKLYHSKQLLSVLRPPKHLFQLAIGANWPDLIFQVCRFDTVFDVLSGQWKILEFNPCDPSMAGVQDLLTKRISSDLSLGHFKIPLIMNSLVGYLKQRTQLDKPKVIFCIDVDAPTYYDFKLQRDALRNLGLDCELAKPDEIHVVGEYASFNNSNYSELYRDHIDDFLNSQKLTREKIQKIFSLKETLVVNSLHSIVGEIKSIFELLSDPNLLTLNRDQRLVIDEMIPWTRAIYPRTTTRKGEQINLVETIIDQQHQFVLKKAYSDCGRHVLIGANAHPRLWRNTLESAIESRDWIVQDFVAPETIKLPAIFSGRTDAYVPYSVGWWMHGAAMAGGILRAAAGGITSIGYGSYLSPVGYYESQPCSTPI